MTVLHSICKQPFIRSCSWNENAKRLSIKIVRGEVWTCCFPPACPVAIKPSRQTFLSRARGSPINTDIPPHRAMHAKRGPYPSGSSTGVYLQLGSYEDRHCEKCHLSSRLAVPSPCCAVNLELLEVSEECPLPMHMFLLPFPLCSLPFSSGRGRGWPGGLGPQPKWLPLSTLGESITETSIVLTWGVIGRWWAARLGGSKHKLISSDSLLSPAYRLSRTLKLSRQDFSLVGGSSTLYISNEHKVFSNTSVSIQPAQHFSRQVWGCFSNLNEIDQFSHVCCWVVIKWK